MKSLMDYTKDAQSKLNKEVGLFWAFSEEQFKQGIEENKHLLPEGTKWASIGSGGYLPSVNVKKWQEGLENIHEDAVKQDLAENGREGILIREFWNYELMYSMEGEYDINFRSSIEGYGFTEEEIGTAYKKWWNEITEKDLI